MGTRTEEYNVTQGCLIEKWNKAHVFRAGTHLSYLSEMGLGTLWGTYHRLFLKRLLLNHNKQYLASY